MGLRCAPQKTELLLIKRGNSQARTVQQVYLTKEGQKIYPTDKPVRLLGLHIQASNRWTHQIHLLKQQLDQLGHMIQKVTTGDRGMRKADTLRLVQAFAISRIIYVAPYMNLLKWNKPHWKLSSEKSPKQPYIFQPRHPGRDSWRWAPRTCSQNWLRPTVSTNYSDSAKHFQEGPSSPNSISPPSMSKKSPGNHHPLGGPLSTSAYFSRTCAPQSTREGENHVPKCSTRCFKTKPLRPPIPAPSREHAAMAGLDWIRLRRLINR